MLRIHQVLEELGTQRGSSSAAYGLQMSSMYYLFVRGFV